MVDVPQLQSSIINREISEQKRREVPLLYRRFTDPFEQPTDTTLLQAMLLALTDKKEDIPNVVKATDNTSFAANIKSLNPQTLGQAVTGQEHRHNVVHDDRTIGGEGTTEISSKIPDAQGDVDEPDFLGGRIKPVSGPVYRGEIDKKPFIGPIKDDSYKETIDDGVTVAQRLRGGHHLNNEEATKKAVQARLALDNQKLIIQTANTLQEVKNKIDNEYDLRKKEIINIKTEMSKKGANQANSIRLDHLTKQNAVGDKQKARITKLIIDHHKEMKENNKLKGTETTAAEVEKNLNKIDLSGVYIKKKARNGKFIPSKKKEKNGKNGHMESWIKTGATLAGIAAMTKLSEAAFRDFRVPDMPYYQMDPGPAAGGPPIPYPPGVRVPPPPPPEERHGGGAGGGGRQPRNWGRRARAGNIFLHGYEV